MSNILVFEPTAILAGRTRDWTQFQQLGDCVIPQIVKEELEFLTKRAIEPQEEEISREFFRFLPDSGWQVNSTQNNHPSFTKKAGEELSKSARLQLAIAQSVYGIATENPNDLVILISNKANLRTEIDNLEENNLTTLTLANFIQWLRTQQKPINISQKLAQLNTSNPEKKVKTSTVKSNSQTQNKATKKSNTNNKSLYDSSYQPKAKVKKKNNPLASIIPSILALAGFIVVGGLIWSVVEPNSFQQFWQKTGLPSSSDN